MNINIEFNLLKERIAKLEKRIDAMVDVISAMGKGQTRAPKEKKAAE